MRIIIGLVALLIFLSSHAYSYSSPILKRLWDVPVDRVTAKTVDAYKLGRIKVEEVYYSSRHYKGIPSRIFAYLCYPADAGEKLPAILLVHGGGGTAHLGRTISWASRGYVVLTIDLPGQGDQRGTSRSTGPDMDVSNLLRIKPDLSYNYLVHAVAAARNGITYLAQREEVDPERIGMVGLSWGGVITLLTNGQDNRLKTAVNIFGAGYIPEGCTWQERFDIMSREELDLWYSYIDPKSFLKSQHAPILFITGTNDHCYYLPTFQKSFAQVTVPKKMLLLPNLRHRFLPYMQRIVWTWLDSKLKSAGSFPEVTLLSVFEKGENKLIIPVIASANSLVEKVTLYYTEGAPSRWTKRYWKSIDAYYEDGVYYFGIPTSMINPEILFYVTVKDNKGATASSPVRSVFKVNLYRDNKTYAVSSPIKKINVHEPPLQILGIKETSELLQIYFSKKEGAYYLIKAEKSSLPDAPGDSLQ